MERPENLKRKIAVIIIILIHLVGVIGLLNPQFQALFLYLVPHYLLLMLVIIVAAHRQPELNLVYFALWVWGIGFAAEWIGIHTHLLFGNYAYGETLGLKFGGVPLIIGVNWLLLVYGTAVLTNRTRLKESWQRVRIGAIILVLLDMLIEPVAVKFNYWHWAGNVVPVKNYVCWFALSAVMLAVFERFQFKTQSWVGAALLGVQFIYFGVLNFLL